MEKWQIKSIADYMYSLLIQPLRQGKKEDNQFYILFSAVAKVFEDIKEIFQRVQKESVVITSEELTELHGMDRQMPKYEGETAESYRNRIALKNILAEMAGTEQGILFVLKLLGYKNARIVPAIVKDNDLSLLNGSDDLNGIKTMNSTTENRTRWAEFYIYLDLNSPLDFDIARKEVRRAKPAGALPIFAHTVEQKSKNIARSETMRVKFSAKGSETMRVNIEVITDVQYLDGMGELAGTDYLNARKGE